MKILAKWYFNELLGYLMSFTSIPVIASDKNKPECIFSSIEMYYYLETAIKRKQNHFIFKLYEFNEIVCW